MSTGVILSFTAAEQAEIDEFCANDAKAVNKMLAEKCVPYPILFRALGGTNMTPPGSLALIKFLVARGADVNARGLHDGTPLQVVAMKGTLETAEFLVSKGADVNVKNRFGYTPLLQAASEYGDTEVLKFLVSAGADVNAQANTGKDKENASLDGNTALHDVVINKDVEIVKLLVSKGARVNMRNRRGYTPLHFAIELGKWDVVEFLVSAGADVNIPVIHEDGDGSGNTPLYLAASKGSLAIVRCLVSHGAVVDVKNYRGLTPLDVATGYGHTEIVEYLSGIK